MFEQHKFRKIIELLKLKRSLIIFDIETTGPAISADKIIKVAYIKIMTNTRVIKDSFSLNPEIKISKEATMIHGITNKELLDKPTFRDRAHEIWDLFYNCYFGGFDIIHFDLPLLRREFIRVGRRFEYSEKDIIDSKVIFNYMEPRTLSVAYKYYCRKEHLDIHNIVADVEVAAEILKKQLQKYEEINNQKFLNEIHEPHEEQVVIHKRKFYWRNGKTYFNFSKYRNKSLAKIAKTDPEFLRWILKSNFPKETKNIIKKALVKK